MYASIVSDRMPPSFSMIWIEGLFSSFTVKRAFSMLRDYAMARPWHRMAVP